MYYRYRTVPSLWAHVLYTGLMFSRYGFAAAASLFTAYVAFEVTVWFSLLVFQQCLNI